jgi:pyruvate kinase
MHVINVTDAGVEVQVYQGGAIVSDRLVTFDERDPQLGYLNQKDKKDIQRGLDGGVHMIIGSYASSVARMQELRMYLDSHDSSKKIIAKIENKPGLEDIDSIAETVDGILLQRTKLMKYVSESDLCNIIARIKASGTSVYVQLDYLTDVMDAPASMDKQYQQWIVLGVDAFLLDDRIAQLEEPLPPIVALYERLADVQLDASTKSLQPFYKESDRTVIDYILYNVSHIMSDITVRAIVCYTTTGYTASRLASFRPNVPIIAFTKSDHTYRYINTLR